MQVSSLLGMASAIVRSRKFKMLLIGLQLGFVAIKYLSEERENSDPTERGDTHKKAKGKKKRQPLIGSK